MKSKHWLYQGFSLMLCLVVVGCTTTNQQQSANIPATSSNITKPNSNNQPVEKVVALTSLSADIISRLDATKLVGMPGSRLLNSDKKFEKIPRVSEGRTLPNLEKVVALKPSLVVGAEGFHEETAQKLKSLGITTSLSKVDSWENLENLTKNLAKSLNADQEPLLKKYQTLLAQQPANESPSTLVLVSRQPILTPNKDSWAGDMLTKFKVNNIAAQLQGESPMRGYISLSPEKILQADPEILIVVETGTGEKVLEQFKSQPFWSQLKAVKNNRVYVFDYYGLVNPGSIEAIEKATNQLKQVLSEKTKTPG